MAVVNILYDPTDIVFHLTDDCGVAEATVISIASITVDNAGSPASTLTYTIKHKGAKVTTDVTDESSLYVDLPTAIAAYEATF